MAIDIQYKDFDTVAYSYRHNIEQLIKASVGLSVEVNISIEMAGAAQQAAQEAADAAKDAQDTAAYNRNSITQLHNNFSQVDGKVDRLQEQFDLTISAINTDLKDLLHRIMLIENELGM